MTDDNGDQPSGMPDMLDPSWIPDFDAERWRELGKRNNNEGLTEAEVAELLIMRDHYQEAMKSGDHPFGIKAEVHFTPIKRLPN